MAARERHAEDLRRYKREHKAWADADGPPDEEPKRPRLDRYMTENTTVEQLTEILRDDEAAKFRAPANKLLIRQDELSELVANLDRYRAGGTGGGDRAAYLRLYNGGRFTVDRVMRGSFAVPNWSACIIGGIQPAVIRKIATDAQDDGLLQRFLYCVPGPDRGGLDRAPDRDALARYEALIGGLTALAPHRPLAGGPDRPVVLHADAHRHRLRVEELARVLAAMPDTSPRLVAAFGKWPGVFARLTLLFHLIEVADARARDGEMLDTAVVSEATAGRTARYVEEILLPHLLRAEHVMFSSVLTEHAR